MKVTVDNKQYTVLDPDDMTNVEVMAIEEATGDPVAAWQKGTMGTITGLVWVTLKRENPQLKFRDVNFKMSDLDMSDDDEDNADDEAEREGKGESADS